MQKKQKFIVDGSPVSIRFHKDDTLLEVALRGKLPLHHSCGGMGTCGTCRVLIIQGLNDLQPPNPIEFELITERRLPPNERLSCQIEPSENLVVEIPTVQPDPDDPL